MKVKYLEECIAEAERFLKKAKRLNKLGGTKKVYSTGEDVMFDDGGMVASVKRASIDLTKSLSQLRKSDYPR